MKLFACVLALAAVTASGLAQSTSNAGWPPPAGSRIRLASPALGERQTGTLISADKDSVVFQSAKFATRVAVRTSDIARMEVAHGTHRSILKGALIGFVVAGGAAAVITAATWKRSTNFDFGRGGDAAFAGVGVGLIGGVVGGILGSVPRESWQPVAMERRTIPRR